MTCSVEWCERASRRRGFCGRHYQRWIKHGDPEAGRSFPDEPLESRMRRLCEVGDCWEWKGRPDRAGYVLVRDIDAGKKVVAHRYVWERLVGQIPDGLELDHLCFNPPCVNPDHLRVVTPSENTATRRVNGLAEIVAKRKAKTHCKRGHPFDRENTYVNPNGTRRCRECTRLRNAGVA